jgi:hypothetical protein
MKAWFTFFASMILAGNAFASDANLLCKEQEYVWIVPSNLSIQRFTGSVTHRLQNDNVFLNDPSRREGEYFYNSLTKAEDRRYISGHKTYMFNDDELTSGTVVHSFQNEVRIARIACQKMAIATK